MVFIRVRLGTEVSHAGQLFATGQQGENADVILWGQGLQVLRHMDEIYMWYEWIFCTLFHTYVYVCM